MSADNSRRLALACFVSLIVLGIAWETWLAPLRPGGWLMALKVVPLAIALPAIAAGRLRAYQWWSMLILLYFVEGAVRATSDAGLSAALAAIETLLSVLAFASILLYVRAIRARPPQVRAAAPASRAPCR
ncbi:MAG: DUF2069 domain-containing protein [Limnobacter sp.]|nr:DUF2069 domain-containing protein [Limnobacter sp.]